MNLKNENGYTLLEIIITMGILAIAIGTSSFGLRSIFNNNVNSYANQFANEIRLVASRELGSAEGESNDRDYKLEVSFDSTGQRVIAVTYLKVGAGAYDELTRINFPKSMTIAKDGVQIDASTNIVGHALYSDETRTFEFDASSGALIVYTPSGDSAEGRYTIRSANSSITRDVVVIQANGRVYVDD